MRLDYDVSTDSLYIHLSERQATDSEEISEAVVLDYDDKGNVVGIDLQHASAKFDLSTLRIHRLPISELGVIA